MELLNTMMKTHFQAGLPKRINLDKSTEDNYFINRQQQIEDLIEEVSSKSNDVYYGRRITKVLDEVVEHANPDTLELIIDSLKRVLKEAEE